MKPCTPLRSLASVLSTLAVLAAGSAQAAMTTTGPEAPAGAGVVEFVDLGALHVDGQMTLDASTSTFHFTTFEMAVGSTVSFVNLGADDSLRLIASAAIRIRGELVFAPASALYIEAPIIELGEGAVIAAPGGSISLIAGPVEDRLRSADLLAGGTVTVLPGASLEVSGAGIVRPTEPVRIGGGGSLSITPGGIVTLQGAVPESVTVQAPVPEPETYGMLLAGLGLVGFMARRRTARK